MVKTKTGWRCEPMHLPLVLKAVAHYKSIKPATLADVLRANGKRLFGEQVV